ncbi:PadR family transcriptional regulator [Nocardioides sp.]|uniref:PadR family transcriptional regulator n=1 Tax=Nocardioides sp. TaxID=35761 RepID=UPI002BAA105A|nr:PadR family transcriptional regulator [Nocardioides sp.]HSX67674.1 PadR family transcriptional regulator [Nocardioides sp.]
MALEHALLVSLRERAASGSELTRRFDKSFGYFWSATHQQIYRTLARMETDGWLTSTVVPQHGKPDTKVYAVSPLGEKVLAAWLVEAPAPAPLRSDLAVKLRGASYAGDRAAVLDMARAQRAEHQARHAAYEQMLERQFPHPEELSDTHLDRYLVLRAGVRVEEGWIGFLDEYISTHERRAGRPEKESR